jgi:histidine triad (HIT) family protein
MITTNLNILPYEYDKIRLILYCKGGIVMSDCIFCKIVAGEIPSSTVFENEDVVAFMDISQVTKGHTLIIPKVHKENIYELTPEISQAVFTVVPKIARALKAEFNPIGLNVLNNNGAPAGQSVFHFHVHLLPRYGESDDFTYKWGNNQDQYTSEDLSKLADSIRNQISSLS